MKGGQLGRVMTKFIRSRDLSVYVLDSDPERARSDGELLLAFEGHCRRIREDQSSIRCEVWGLNSWVLVASYKWMGKNRVSSKFPLDKHKWSRSGEEDPESG